MGLLDKLKTLIKSHVKENFDPSIYNDEIAMQADWKPLVPGGTNFKTKNLSIKPGVNKAIFKASIGSILFGGIFLLIGVGIMISGISKLISSGYQVDNYFLIGFGLIFGTVGMIILHFFTKPVTFDKESGYFYKGRVSREKLLYSEGDIKDLTPLKNIYALQIIAEYCSGNKSSYYSYELNIILENGERMNVIDHGNLKAIRDDANSVAEFLDIKVWDAA